MGLVYTSIKAINFFEVNADLQEGALRFNEN